jgi:hypothetical protein
MFFKITILILMLISQADFQLFTATEDLKVLTKDHQILIENLRGLIVGVEKNLDYLKR